MAELLVIAGVVLLLLAGSRFPRLFSILGRWARPFFWQVKWLYHHVSGDSGAEIRAEENVGARLAEAFLRRTPLDSDFAAQDRVQRVGVRLSQLPSAGGRRFQFHVVLDDDTNAFVLPGGHVFLTRRIAGLCQDDHELAFVLAHEMAHAACGHAAERSLFQIWLGLLKMRTLAGKLFGLAYSREQELEADAQALKSMREAGFNPSAAADLLRKLGRLSRDDGPLLHYLSTRPPIADRLHKLGL